MYYKRNKTTKTTLKANTSYEGETIEQKIHRIVNNKEPIKDGAPLIYSDRKDGVQPQYDIRTDRFEVAIDAMTAVKKTHMAKREESIKERGWTKNEETGKWTKTQPKTGGTEGNGGAESSGATS